MLRHQSWSSLSLADYSCAPVIQHSSKHERVVETRRGGNVSLECRVWSDPVSEVTWSWSDLVLGNNSHLTIRHYPGHSGMVTSILDIVDTGPDMRGVYTCTATNRGGADSDPRTLVVQDPDLLEQLIMLKLYVMAGVGGCVVLLSSLIAATCIYTARRKTFKYQRAGQHAGHEHGCWSDTDSVDTESRPFFRFRESSVNMYSGHQETSDMRHEYQLVPTQEKTETRIQSTPDILIQHTCSPETQLVKNQRLVLLQHEAMILL